MLSLGICAFYFHLEWGRNRLNSGAERDAPPFFDFYVKISIGSVTLRSCSGDQSSFVTRGEMKVDIF